MGGAISNEQWQVDEERFERCRALGKGSYGKVLAVLTQDGQFRALKQLSKRKIIQKKIIHVLKREKQILVRSQEAPFIVPLYRTFQTEFEAYFVLGLLEGGDLRFHMDEAGRFNEEILKFWCAQLTLALEGLHSLNIVHRDIKPENVLLDMKGYLHISDFTGAVQLAGEEREHDPHYIGTIWYMAPEVLNDEESGIEVDWWALGALLYELGCGEPPHAHYVRELPTRDEQYPALAKAFEEHEIEYPERFSEEFKDFLEGLLQMDPDDRFGADDVKNHPWMESIDWDAILSRTATPPFMPHTDSINFHVEVELDDAFATDTVVPADVTPLTAEEKALFNDWDWVNPHLYKPTLVKRALAIMQSPEKLQKGLMLWEKDNIGTTGRILFFLEDLPEDVELCTTEGIAIIRTGNKVIIGEDTTIEIPAGTA